MVNTDAHPAYVGGCIIHAIRIGLSERFVHEVINAYPFGITFRSPLFSIILEVTDVFFFLRVHRYNGLTTALKLFNPPLNIFELRVTIRMTRAFRSFLIALKAITQIVEQRCYCLMSDLIAQRLKGCG